MRLGDLDALMEIAEQQGYLTIDDILNAPTIDAVPAVLPERYRVVAGRHESGRFYSDLTGEEVANILNAYASGMLKPVVRCKDCKHCSDVMEYYADHKENKAHSKPGKACFIGLPRVVYPDDFCSRGERKDGGSP